MNTTSLLRVTSIRVTKLFGIYNHHVPLSKDNRITIIHGPNGVGKTVLLKLVEALFLGNIFEVVRIPFETFEVSLSDNSTFGIVKYAHQALLYSESEEVLREDDKTKLGSLYLLHPGKDTVQVDFTSNQLNVGRWASLIEREAPWLSRSSRDRFFDRQTEEEITAFEVVRRYSQNLTRIKSRQTFFKEPSWFVEIRERVRVHFIEAQRLLKFNTNTNTPWYPGMGRSQNYSATVKTYAKDMQGRVSHTLQAYAKESQALDQSFPQRMLLSQEHAELSVDDLKGTLQALEDKRQKLKNIGLVDEDPRYSFDPTTFEKLDDTRRTVMALYAKDTERKLGALDDLANRVEILLEIINKKFKHKSIVLDKERGLAALTENGQMLDLDVLSSGEQHELVLLYDLLFRTKPNTLVLIDEPELSLHVTWQKTFLPDLLGIVATGEYDVVLATHSPFIVGEHSDLMIPLSSEEKQS